MKRIFTQTLVWMVVVSLLAAAPIACVSAMIVSPLAALVSAPTSSADAPLVESDSYAGSSEHRIDRLLFFSGKTEEESRETLQDTKHLSPFVDSLPGVQSVAARQLLHSVNRSHLAASSVSRHLRL